MIDISDENIVKTMEEYVVSEDRAEKIKDWTKKNAPTYQQYIRLCNVLVEDKATDEDIELLKKWMVTQRYGESLNIILKFCLNKMEQEGVPEKRNQMMEQFNQDFLRYTFNDERDMRGGLGTTESSSQTGASTNFSVTKVVDPKLKIPLKSELTKEEKNEMSTSFLLKAIVEDKGYYEFDLRVADLSLLKKIDLYNMKSPSRMTLIFDRLEDFAYNKVV